MDNVGKEFVNVMAVIVDHVVMLHVSFFLHQINGKHRFDFQIEF